MNTGAAVCVSPGGGASCSLLPRQVYLSVDEDAAGALERKRNFIYCTVVSIMKHHKEIHIDNLVYKVRPDQTPTRPDSPPQTDWVLP